MTELLKALGTYSVAALLTGALLAGAIFLMQKTTEKAIEAEFARRAKVFDLVLERRSRFEEMILMERYQTISDILTRLTRVATDLNRQRHGTVVEGLMRDGDIVPLTEVYELLLAKRHVLTDRFHPQLGELANLLLQLANAGSAEQVERVGETYQARLLALQRDMNEAFGLDRIEWDQPGAR